MIILKFIIRTALSMVLLFALIVMVVIHFLPVILVGILSIFFMDELEVAMFELYREGQQTFDCLQTISDKIKTI